MAVNRLPKFQQDAQKLQGSTGDEEDLESGRLLKKDQKTYSESTKGKLPEGEPLSQDLIDLFRDAEVLKQDFHHFRESLEQLESMHRSLLVVSTDQKKKKRF